MLKIIYFCQIFYFRGFFPTLSSSLEYSFFTWNLSIFRPYLAVFSHWIYTTPLWQNLLTFRSTIVFLLFFLFYVCCLRFQYCEIWFKISMCICSVRIPSLEYSLFTWNLSIFRFNLAVLLYRLGKSISFSRFKFKNCKPSHQTTLKSFVFVR